MANKDNYAQMLGVEATKNMFTNIDTDEDADWTIISKNGMKFKCHSHVVKHKSDVLLRMMTSDFKDKKNKTIHMKDFSTRAVQFFLKFMYCYELDNKDKNLDLKTLKELIRMGDMFNVSSLKNAASKNMEKFFTKNNIIEILDFKKKHQSDGMDECFGFIINNFEIAQLKKDGVLKKHPDLGLCYLNLLVDGGYVKDQTVRSLFRNQDQSDDDDADYCGSSNSSQGHRQSHICGHCY